MKPAFSFSRLALFCASLNVLHCAPSQPSGQPIVTYSISVNGSGSVVSEPTGIDCGADCNHDFNVGTTGRLRAVPDPGFQFAFWSGGCVGFSSICEFNVLGDSRNSWQTVAHFVPGSPVCSNGQLDTSETDIDCGGSTCSRCAASRACQQNGDCQSNSCIDHRCSACPLEQQLLANPGAEAGRAAADQDEAVAVPGWVTQGPFIVIDWGNAGGFPSATDPGPDSRGLNFFSGGNQTPVSATQEVSLASCSSLIAQSRLKLDFSAYLGGYIDQGDNATLTAQFMDGSTSLGTITLGPVTAADRQNLSGLLLRQGALDVPVGARSLLVTMTMRRTDGSGNDGYADNLSAILSLKQ